MDLASIDGRLQSVREHCRKTVSRLQYYHLASSCLNFHYSMENDYEYSKG